MAPVRPFVTHPVLTGIAIGYVNRAQAMIADEVMPRTDVPSEKFSWTEYPLAEGFTVPDTFVGRRGRVNQVSFTGVEKESSTQDYGLEDPIPNSDIREAEAQRAAGLSIIDPRNHSTEMLTHLMLLDREIRVAATVQNPANYAASRRVTLSGTSQFSDYTNSDPIGVIKTGLESTLIYRPNTMVMGQAVWSKLSSHPVIVNAIRGNLTNKGIVTREELARLFEVQRVLVGESYVNVARRGQDPSLSRVWGKHLELLYIDPTVRVRGGVTWGLTAQRGTRIAGTIPDEDVGLEGGERVRVGEKLRELVVAPDVGYQIQNAVA